MGNDASAGSDLRSSLLARTPQVAPRAGEEVLTMLITVKAYPVIGRKIGEAVCVAGVSLDSEQAEWIRLFPVPFRKLPQQQQFEKYDVVRLRVITPRTKSDRRAETRTPNLDTLVRGPNVATGRGSFWTHRRELLGDLRGQTTMCKLNEAAKKLGQGAPSLGLIKPRAIQLDVVPNPDYKPGGEVQLDVDLFGDEHELLEKTPFIAIYSYKCDGEPSCPGHKQTLIDWESGALARRLVASRSQREAIEAHKAKFLGELCGADRDVYFYVGNQHQHPASFLILGIYSPKVGGPIDTPLDFGA